MNKLFLSIVGLLLIQSLCNAQLWPICKKADTVNPYQCSECQNGYFLNNGTCYPCISNCLECSSTSNCTNCTTPYTINQTDSSCVLTPPENCQIAYVNTTNQTACAKCSTGYQIADNGSCALNCSAIDKNCLECSSTSTCTKCTTPYTINQTDSSCVLTPPENCQIAYVNTTNQTACQSCSKGYVITGNGQCTRDCSAISGCSVCDLNNLQNLVCTACEQSFYLQEGSCYSCSKIKNCSQCILGNAQNDSLICTQCSTGLGPNYFGQSCVDCSVVVPNSKSCKACQFDQANYRVSCTNCGVGFFIAQNGSCITCAINNCNICTADSKDSNIKCTTCAEGYKLTQDSQSCVKCPDFCQTCQIDGQGKTTCQECITGFFLKDQQTCSNCSFYPNCIQCDTDQCTNCAQGFYLNNEHTCTQCSPTYDNCASCNLTNCLSCNAGYQYLAGDNKCYQSIDYCATYQQAAVENLLKCQQCADGFTTNNDQTKCLDCSGSPEKRDEGCIQCSVDDKDNLKCTICAANYTLPENKAQCEKCPDFEDCYQFYSNCSCKACGANYYFNEDKTKCLKCVDNCTSCDTTSQKLNICTQCAVGYYSNGDQTGCLPCSEKIINCQDCKDSEVCDKCVSGFLVTIEQDKCLTCHQSIPGCLTCEYKNSYQQNTIWCTQCKTGTVLVDGTCLPCPVYCNNCSYSINNQTGDYPLMDVSLSCQACAAGYTLSTNGANSGVCIQEKSSISSYLIFGLLQIIAIAFFLI